MLRKYIKILIFSSTVERVQLKSKEAKKLINYNYSVNKKDRTEILDDRILLINSKPSFFLHNDKWLPTLQTLQEHSLLKEVIVDMGAVKFVIKGADIMRPGIKEIDETIESGEYIVILDENNKKPLAVGKTLFSGKEIKSMESGKVIENIHYVGDDLWKT